MLEVRLLVFPEDFGSTLRLKKGAKAKKKIGNSLTSDIFIYGR